MRIVIKLLRYFLAKLREINEEYKYNPSTIAEKFRKQGARIGENCSIQINKLASEPYLIEIGNNVAIAAGVALITHDGASVVFRDEFPALRHFGRIVIEDNCFIGSRSIITGRSENWKRVRGGPLVRSSAGCQAGKYGYRKSCYPGFNSRQIQGAMPKAVEKTGLR